jgi:hypothetical protein
VPTIAAIVIVSVATVALVSENLAVARLAAARIAVGTNESLWEPVPTPDPPVAKGWRVTTRGVRGALASQIVLFGDFRNTA